MTHDVSMRTRQSKSILHVATDRRIGGHGTWNPSFQPLDLVVKGNGEGVK
jgi:hypothetical protein